ncbi:TetR/AcrR family transcriptional regulator [Wukongibacter baidiensis]|uniref:TetR/AcrR family transcriptional regulator n=1 Tax=Wukongibacter baidiensis TaxID=1723361 RepID=UPI003D7FEB40
MNKVSTAERILEAAMNLFSEKGYTDVTTKEIAKMAEISEMTVFRHFRNKQNLYEKAVDRYIFSPKIKQVFNEEMEWDLEKDLMKISSAYQEALIENRSTILMQFKSNDSESDIDFPLKKFPNEFKKFLVEYFTKMNELDIVKNNPEVLAINFLSGNFGIFAGFIIFQVYDTNAEMNTCIREFVNTFVKGIISCK